MTATMYPQTTAHRWWSMLASVLCWALGFGRMTGWQRDGAGYEYLSGEDGFLARRGGARYWKGGRQ